MQKTAKRNLFIHGFLCLPLMTGSRAVIFHDGGVVRTSEVAAIRTVSKDTTIFETADTVYCVTHNHLFSPAEMAVRQAS